MEEEEREEEEVVCKEKEYGEDWAEEEEDDWAVIFTASSKVIVGFGDISSLIKVVFMFVCGVFNEFAFRLSSVTVSRRLSHCKIAACKQAIGRLVSNASKAA